MAKRVTIHGNVADIEEVELLRSVPVDSLFRHIENRPAQNIGPLPKTAVFIRWDESNPRERHLYVMTQLPPLVRNLRYINRRYNLSIPWTYFLFDFSTTQDPTTFTGIWAMGRTRVYWAREEATGWNSQLSRALIANCDEGGVICYGDTGVDAALPLNARVDRLTTDFYQTTFMHDSGTGVPFRTDGAQTWARWEQETAQHGVTAYRNFPDWDGPYMPNLTVLDAFNTNIPRTQRTANVAPRQLLVPGGMEDLPEAFTFQRAEQWLTPPGITAVDRHRLFVALQNLQADNPATIEAPVVATTANNDINTAEGGTPIDTNVEREAW